MTRKGNRAQLLILRRREKEEQRIKLVVKSFEKYRKKYLKKVEKQGLIFRFITLHHRRFSL